MVMLWREFHKLTNYLKIQIVDGKESNIEKIGLGKSYIGISRVNNSFYKSNILYIGRLAIH